MDLVFLRDLSVRTVIGVDERERAAPQEVLVTLELEADLGAAAATDDLSCSIDYSAVATLVRQHAEASRFRLLEAFAGSIATLVLERFPPVRAVRVRVEKPRVIPGARSVGVELHRQR